MIQIGSKRRLIIARDCFRGRSTSIDGWRILNPGRCRPHLSPWLTCRTVFLLRDNTSTLTFSPIFFASTQLTFLDSRSDTHIVAVTSCRTYAGEIKRCCPTPKRHRLLVLLLFIPTFPLGRVRLRFRGVNEDDNATHSPEGINLVRVSITIAHRASPVIPGIPTSRRLVTFLPSRTVDFYK